MKIKDLNGCKLISFEEYKIKVCKDRYIKYINNSIYIYNKQRLLVEFQHRFNNGNSLINDDGTLIHNTKDGCTYSINIIKHKETDKIDLFWMPKSVIKQAKKEYKTLTTY